MWVLGSTGVFIYSPDGKDKKVSIDGEAICHEEPEKPGSGYYSTCRFYDVISDGKKYVWASLARGIPKIDLFDINTGSVVGSFETCMSPSSLEYHPLRDEVWVRCSDMAENSTMQTSLDVFSASSPSGAIQTNILMEDRALKEGLSSTGYSVIDNSLGDVGYLTDRDIPYLFKVDLSSKKILDKIEMTPPSNGLYEAAYSPVNKHIFARSVVCCTCGFEGSDLGESCGRYDGSPINPMTGANAYVFLTCPAFVFLHSFVFLTKVYSFSVFFERVVVRQMFKASVAAVVRVKAISIISESMNLTQQAKQSLLHM
jgi:hypothetical protein